MRCRPGGFLAKAGLESVGIDGLKGTAALGGGHGGYDQVKAREICCVLGIESSMPMVQH